MWEGKHYYVFFRLCHSSMSEEEDPSSSSSSSMDKSGADANKFWQMSAAEKRADANKFWQFFECAMNDIAYKDELVFIFLHFLWTVYFLWQAFFNSQTINFLIFSFPGPPPNQPMKLAAPAFSCLRVPEG
jgi:hypothetical protein